MQILMKKLAQKRRKLRCHKNAAKFNKVSCLRLFCGAYKWQKMKNLKIRLLCRWDTATHSSVAPIVPGDGEGRGGEAHGGSHRGEGHPDSCPPPKTIPLHAILNISLHTIKCIACWFVLFDRLFFTDGHTV